MKERGIEINKYDMAEYVRLPSGAVEHIIFNEGLLEGSPDPRIRKLADPDNLLRLAGFFGLKKIRTEGGLISAKKDDATLKLQPPGYDRAVVINLPRIGFQDEYGNRFAELSAKGTGITQIPDLFSRALFFDPLGLFGERHGVQDMLISDEMAKHGGKVSRGLAVITLNHGYLKALDNRIPLQYRLGEQVEKVEENGDIACIYVRIVGADRFDTSSSSSESKRIFGFNQKVERAARMVFQEEDDMGLEAYLERYFFTDARQSLLNISFGISEGLDSKYTRVLDVARHFFNFNHGVFSVVENHFPKGLKANIHNGNQDMRGGWVDFENFMPESGQSGFSIIHDKPTEVLHEYFSKGLIKSNTESFTAGVLRAEEACKNLGCKLPQR